MYRQTKKNQRRWNGLSPTYTTIEFTGSVVEDDDEEEATEIEIRIKDDDECTQDEEDNQEDGMNQEEADKENVDEDNFE